MDRAKKGMGEVKSERNTQVISEAIKISGMIAGNEVENSNS